MNQDIARIVKSLSLVILDKETEIKIALTCLLSKGHLLIEDLPGMGKTTLAHALAYTFGLNFQRIQFTNDLLPLDISGSSIYNVKSQSFDFHEGPLFCQLLLADELNRASPKTQSALLEAMEEHQVTIDKQTYQLPKPFFVIATQNPKDQFGTHELPESQLDRFFMRLSLGYPSRNAERLLIENNSNRRALEQTLFDTQALTELQKASQLTILADVVVDYILRIVEFTRNTNIVRHGLSPRASIAMATAAKTWAFIHDVRYVTPDDVYAIAPFVCAHRLGLTLQEFQQHILEKIDIGA
ncbi:FIG022979: MoxR-like ATPases [Pseudoalteromonas luteoviolacea B = ATCC 29581]|nr:FIG022979: MoxR-like ATPases [Pseudoalteromonas luteoviolacea B = ATCC 29581]